jgi:hypothetical protein
MDLIEGSETSANINQPLGIHPKIETVNTEHSESLKSRMIQTVSNIFTCFLYFNRQVHREFLITLYVYGRR